MTEDYPGVINYKKYRTIFSGGNMPLLFSLQRHRRWLSAETSLIFSYRCCFYKVASLPILTCFRCLATTYSRSRCQKGQPILSRSYLRSPCDNWRRGRKTACFAFSSQSQGQDRSRSSSSESTPTSTFTTQLHRVSRSQRVLIL